MTSIIIPTYNEADTITPALDELRRLRGDFEVIVVDGTSYDGTRARVEAALRDFPGSLRLLTAERNRALQLNHAARLARGDVLLFLHADAVLSAAAVESVEQAFEDTSVVGGNFSLIFEGDSAWNSLFTWVNRARRWFGIYYGDSGIFVRREVFQRLGGFKPMPLMEDYEFVRRLERAGNTVCLSTVVLVSDRRWRVQGVLRTLLSWVILQSLYSLGVSPKLLVRWYWPVRAGSGAEGRAGHGVHPAIARSPSSKGRESPEVNS